MKYALVDVKSRLHSLTVQTSFKADSRFSPQVGHWGALSPSRGDGGDSAPSLVAPPNLEPHGMQYPHH